ncbi:MAG: hypothetical protein DA330_07475 [Nitrososphaera sp.]|nr:hypothetical protein [Nitrososphaera sp.]
MIASLLAVVLLSTYGQPSEFVVIEDRLEGETILHIHSDSDPHKISIIGSKVLLEFPSMADIFASFAVLVGARFGAKKLASRTSLS